MRSSVRPSVRSPKYPLSSCTSSLMVHPTNRDRFKACPSVQTCIMLWVCSYWKTSVCPSVGFVQATGAHWAYPSRFASCCGFVHTERRLFVGRGFRAFAGEHMEGMAWNFACWCIVTTFRTDKIMVKVCSICSFWRHFDLVKRVKFGVSGHFLENAWRE